MKTKRQKKLFVGLMVSITFLFCLELAARSMLTIWPGINDQHNESTPLSSQGGMPFDRELLWKLPETIPMDKRTREMTQDRIVFLGDSSVYGFGVKPRESFVTKSGQCLNQSVENAGVPGYSSTQVRIRLAQILSENPPKMVVVAALWSDMMQSQWSDRELYMRFGSTNWADKLEKETLWSASALFRMIRSVTLKMKGERIENPKIFWNAIQKGDPDVDKPRVSLTDYKRNLNAIHSMSAASDVEVVTLLLPTNSTEPQPDKAHLYRIAAKKIAEAHKSKTVDMDLRFRQYDASEIKNRFLDVVHPNARGHSEIAQTLCSALKTQID